MDSKRDITVVRLFSLFLLFFILYLCWVPSFSSLKQGTGHVSFADNNLTRFNATFTLDDGQTLHCTAKGWWIFGSQICPALTLRPAQASQESVLIGYSGQKVWFAASAVDHRKIINYTSIRNSRWGVMALSVFIFLGIFFFAPLLIAPKYDRFQ